jgi:hypothetical protein
MFNNSNKVSYFSIRLIVLFIGLVVAGGFFYGYFKKNASDKASSGKWIQFVDDSLKISFKYPSDWVVWPRSDDVKALTISNVSFDSGNNRGFPAGACKISFAVRPNPSLLSLSDWLDDAGNNVGEEYSSTLIIFNGHSGVKTKNSVYTKFSEAEILRMSLICGGGGRSDGEKIFNEVLYSITF